ncbi:MAG: hypothetical protein KF841_05985 [Phycisphaerae bacterium]|nr:hypothetical protein [Phycisphaerae bacterium]
MAAPKYAMVIRSRAEMPIEHQPNWMPRPKSAVPVDNVLLPTIPVAARVRSISRVSAVVLSRPEARAESLLLI